MAELTSPEVFVERYCAGLESGFDLIERRGRAVFDYLSALPGVRAPDDLAALQTAYWSRAADDYKAAFSKVLATAPIA